MEIGANLREDGACDFTVWAPLRDSVELKIVGPGRESLVPMDRDADGYWHARCEAGPGTLYVYRLDGSIERPDPASSAQPLGVHGPAQVVDHEAFRWQAGADPVVPLERMIIYELHTGTFTPEGTFDAAAARLDDLRDLGVTAVELMPVAQFPGGRNWGYDGAYPFAVQDSYAGPDGLRRLVDACHRRGLAVLLDVVYNHLGPEGSYLRDFAPYFTAKYRSPWGDAVNFDDAWSDGVRNYFIRNALHWFRRYRIDGLRLDAIHGIFDLSAKPFLAELAESVDALRTQTGRSLLLIAESDLNDARAVRPRSACGWGLDAQWCDDFHHALHVLLTGQSRGYYADFDRVAHFVKACTNGFVYAGEYSRFRKRRHGSPTDGIPARRFVVCSQNHDQVGNQLLGERLARLTSFEGLKLAAAAVLLSPYVPLLFMGEEYGEDAPFRYFVSHSDPALVEAVREGRKKEFEGFGWTGDYADPQSEATFLASKLDWGLRSQGRHAVLLRFYKHLIALRRSLPALGRLDRDALEACGDEERKLAVLRRRHGDSEVVCLLHFGGEDVPHDLDLPPGAWRKIVDSSEEEWLGPGSRLPERLEGGRASVTLRPQSVAAYERVSPSKNLP